MKKALIMAISIWLHQAGYAQTECKSTFANILGSVIEDERGYTLTPSPDMKYVFVGGVKNDSAAILKLDLDGTIIWTRTFDVVSNRGDHIHKLFVDNEGMLAVAGTAGTQQNGGSIFVFRYDPDQNIVLWANEYRGNSNNYCIGLIENGPGGNYILSTNPQSPNVAELVALDKNSGSVISTFSKHYELGSSATFYDFAFHSGELYACGRFTDGGSVAEMRNTVAKLDPSNGNVNWMKLGHRSNNTAARLYGFDLVIVQDNIYTVYSGDDSGSSVNNTKVFMQKTDLNGNLLWIKQYDLPGGINDWGDELIESHDGLVILARNRVAPSNMILFKTDLEGEIIWGNAYDFSLNDNATPIGSVESQLIEVNDYLFFTAYAQDAGKADMIVVKTDLEGQIQDTCIGTIPIQISTLLVSNPVFYNKSPSISDYIPMRIGLPNTPGVSTSIASNTICKSADVVESMIEVTLCLGESYDGYTMAGEYVDTFISSGGCDSIRTLQIQVADVIESMIAVTLCPGGSYDGYILAGEYVDTFISSGGCDSIRTLQIQIADVIESMITVTLCLGESYDGYTEAGEYVDTFISSGGCDSIRTLQIQIADVIESMIAVTLCPGESYDGYTEAGEYVDTFISSGGCDSIRTLQIQVADVIESMVAVTLCPGESYDGYTEAGEYVDTFISSGGCDSIRTLQIQVADVIESMVAVTLCPGESYDGYTEAGEYIDAFISSGGCDSIRTLQIQIVEVIESMISLTLCPGGSYDGYTEAGEYVDAFISSGGCDSIRTLQIHIADNVSSFIETNICDRDMEGHSQPGIYVDTLKTALGCDSIRTIMLHGLSTYIPNVFSPNDDNVNDRFEIFTYPDIELNLIYFGIFDRFGNMAFQQQSGPISWNGKDSNGKYYNPGVFAYVLKYYCSNKEVMETGNVTLIR
jgi:gliding motility-associated-like protein